MELCISLCLFFDHAKITGPIDLIRNTVNVRFKHKVRHSLNANRNDS